MKLNEALKRCRKLRKATQKQAAAAAGVTESMYQFYEYGKSEPTASVLTSLADYFDVPLDYLTGRSDDSMVAVACAIPEKLHTQLFEELNKQGISSEHITYKSHRAAIIGEGFIIDELTPKQMKIVLSTIEDWSKKRIR